MRRDGVVVSEASCKKRPRWMASPLTVTSLSKGVVGTKQAHRSYTGWTLCYAGNGVSVAVSRRVVCGADCCDVPIQTDVYPCMRDRWLSVEYVLAGRSSLPSACLLWLVVFEAAGVASGHGSSSVVRLGGVSASEDASVYTSPMQVYGDSSDHASFGLLPRAVNDCRIYAARSEGGCSLDFLYVHHHLLTVSVHFYYAAVPFVETRVDRRKLPFKTPS